MKIKIVILDNDSEFGNDVAEIISGLTPNYFKKLDTDITAIEAIARTTPKEAFDLIKNGDVSLLSLDIELDSNVRGDEEYEKLFFEGTAVPCIVVSAVVDKMVTEEHLERKGVSEVIQISRGEHDVVDRLVAAVCQVLGDRLSKIKQIQVNTNMMQIQNNSIQFKDEEYTVQQLIDSIIAGNHSPIDEKDIIKFIVRECVHQSQLNQDHNYGFKRDD